VGDFTKDQLLARGGAKERLLDVAEVYEHVARITLNFTLSLTFAPEDDVICAS